MARHSNATEARITVTQFASSLLLIIEDNGDGFDLETRKNGNGIFTMNQRVAALSGQFSITSGSGEGTKISCMIPLAKISD